MRDYNAIVRMNPVVFAYMIKTGRIPEFKKLYQEFAGMVKTQENWLDALSKAVKQSRYFNPRKVEDLMTGSDIGETFNKANKEKWSIAKNED